MATTDSVIINLLIKEQGVIAAINSQKTLAKQTVELTKYIDNLAERYVIDTAQIVRAIETYNAKIGTTGQGKAIAPTAVGAYKIEAAELARIRADEARASQEREAAAQRRIALVEQERLARLNANRALKEEQQILIENEKLTQASLKETPADKAFGSKLEAESKATIKAENEQIKRQEQDILANKRQQLLIDLEMSKNRVVDIEQARKEAEIEDARINKARQRLSIEQKTTQVLAQHNTQLTNIAKMIPADQSIGLAKLVPQMAQESGVPINTLMREIQTRFNILPDTIRKSTQEIRQFQNGLAGTVKEMFNLNAIMNTAFGVGMAMLIFQLQMMITKFFQDTIQQAKDLSNAIGKISIAEKVMSKGGIDVTGKELLGIVSELEKKFTLISNVDMLKATGDTALKMAGTGITPKELQGMLEAGLAAQIRNPEKTLDEILGTITNAALTGNVEGIKALQLTISDDLIKKYAVRNGLIADENVKLTEQQKIHARIGIMMEDTNKTLEDTLALQDNLANAGGKLSASWKNLTEALSPAVDVWNALIYLLAYGIQGITTMIGVIRGTVEPTNKFQENMQKALQYVFTMGKFWTNVLIPATRILQTGWEKILWIYEKISGKKISEQPSIANLENQDTPTGPILPDGDETEDEADKIKKALIDLAEAMDQFADRARNMEEDFRNTMQKLQQDFDIDRSRFMEDWAIDRQKIIDDSEAEIEKKQREYNRRKIDAEAKLQEDLRQLREKYLMNLDDALHERDARQVLRLGREYAMNRQNLINEFGLRQNGDAAQHAADLADLAKKRNDRLKELDLERALKLKRMEEDFALKKKREQEEHKLAMSRLEQEKQDKLRQLAQSLSDQLNLSDSGSRAIYELFLSYFGPKGAIPNVMDSSYKTVVGYAERMAKKLQEILTKFKTVQKAAETIPGNGNVVPSSTSTIYRAKGGLDIATKATQMVFGEAGPELALTVPLNKLSTLQGGLGNLLGGSSQSAASRSEIIVSLSPDLEARIVQKSEDRMANAIQVVRRNAK